MNLRFSVPLTLFLLLGGGGFVERRAVAQQSAAWVDPVSLRSMARRVIAIRDFRQVPIDGAVGYYEFKRVVGDPAGERTVDYVTVWMRDINDDESIAEVQFGSERWTLKDQDHLYVDNWMFQLFPSGEKKSYSHGFMLQNRDGRIEQDGGLFPRKGGEVHLEGAEAEARAKLASVLESWSK